MSARNEQPIDINYLIHRAKQGDSTIVPELRKYLNDHPQHWEQIGNLAIASKKAWIKTIAGKDKHSQECIVNKVNALTTELNGTHGPLIRQLLVERVLCCWLQLHYYEICLTTPTLSTAATDSLIKRQQSANNMYLKAIKELVTFDKLNPRVECPAPSVQKQTAAAPKKSTPSRSSTRRAGTMQAANSNRNVARRQNRVTALYEFQELPVN